MAFEAPFYPRYTKALQLTPAAVSAQVTIPAGSKQMILTNTGANEAFIRVGSGTFTATVNDYLVMAGTQISLSKLEDHDQLAHMSPAGTSLHVIFGEGF